MASFMTIPCYGADYSINWTDDEIAFIKNHPVIRLGIDPQFVPFEYIDKDGNYKGIATDYIALISERTGIKFEVIPGLTWPEAYDKALAGDIDVLPAISKTDEREKHFLFSEPYYNFKRVIAIRDTDTGISGIEDLEKLTVAVQRNSSHHSYLLSYPKINLSLYDSVEVALTEVANGTEKAFVGNLATTNYLIRANGLNNLKFIAFEAEKQQALYFAVRKDWPELVSVLNKALDTISEEERFAIHNEWIGLETEIDYGPMIRIISIIGLFVAVVFAVSFYWIVRLRKEVRMRELIQVDLEKAKREADEANEFKSSFMARMSHEIRTPLNAITGMAYLLKRTEITLTQGMYIDRVTQAADNMLSIINDILDFSKIEAGKVELEITSFSLDQVIQNVVNIASYKIEAQEIGLKLSKEPQIPNWFFGDPKRIEQILINLLNNAAKFTNEGEITLDIRLIAKENEKYHLSFSIRDTGIGMTEDQVKKLFTPFIQGDSSINRRFGGSGLGLSIVKNLVEMMGGRIQVFSTPGEGSTFIIHLPLRVDKEKEAAYVKAWSANNFKDFRTLVLEKTGASMNLIGSYLATIGMQQCEFTTSEASALSMLEAADGKFTQLFDLFIIDYDTPAEGGFKFLESLRNNKAIVKVPKIIILLPMMRADLFDKLNEYGVNMGIGKPIIPSILLNGILDIFKLNAVSTSQPSDKMKLSPARLDKSYYALLVEDNKTNQLIAKSLLQQLGIQSIVANDGRIGVELYRQHKDKIDLIIMDLHMPVMNGYEAAKEIRKLSANVPILAMTADVILGVREKCEQSGIYYHIGKPFDPDRFIQTIKDIIIENEAKHVQDLRILDQDAGLINLGRNGEIYRQVLNEYFKENQETLDKISLAVDQKRYGDAAQVIHKLKSSSGSIGAKTLYDLSIKLQKALNEAREEEILLLTEEFSHLFIKLLGEIEEFLEGN
ncbi:MAG: transporter substrate-binding domain-containing protein [Syntrophomonadaceae bacterium]|jgi:signal transduction histidine kinase/DNA-binding response OmpR family regulator|nr:transporter substrate-binding domain-containing protein [Syntrophomonadaceae bacterium]